MGAQIKDVTVVVGKYILFNSRIAWTLILSDLCLVFPHKGRHMRLGPPP